MTETEQKPKETIGERLHKARLKKKTTVDEAYKATKIHPKVITALEEDRYGEFLSPIYIKAFLKSYCRYLELDANKIIDDYDKLSFNQPSKPVLEIKEAEEANAAPKIDFDISRLIHFNKELVLPIAVGTLGVIVGISFLVFIANAIMHPKAPKAAKAKTEAVEPKPDTAFKKPLSISPSQPLTLVVKTKDTVWLQVKADGKTVFQNVLKKGNAETYRADDRFDLWTGKGEYLDLYLNGNTLGSPGNGVIRSIILTREGLQVEKK